MNKTIYLAGGCFWGVQALLDRVPGVVDTEVGYANGTVVNPSYEEVCTGATGAAETVFVTYDDEKITLVSLLRVLFDAIDPTTLNKQGPDIETQYRSGIYYVDEKDKAICEEFLSRLQHAWSAPIVTEVLPLHNFYAAEEYHQKYLKKNPGGYCHIRLD